jgi:NADH-quinone oxidoreductase subunit M
MIYERTHSREISDNSALGIMMPIYVSFLVIFSLSSLAFPGTNSFVGELLVLVACFSKYRAVGGFAVVGAILAAAYMLRLVQKMVWADSDGHLHPGDRSQLFDLNLRETATLMFLAIFVFWIGFHPTPLLNVMDTSTAHLLEQMESGMQHASPAGHHAHLSGLGETVKNLMAFKY